MGLIRLDKARESAPIVLNLIKDTGWCYTWGIVSVVTIIPVLSFQVYECWRARKDGTYKVFQNIMATLAVAANGTWMIGDLYFHDRLRSYGKLIFNLSFICLGLYTFFVYRQSKKEKKEETQRVMMVSKQTKSLVFMHTRTAHLHRRPMVGTRVVMARHRVRQ